MESVSLTEAIDGDLLVTIGTPDTKTRVLIRIHSECVFAEVFGSELCDCRTQLDLALSRLRKEGCGFLFYLRIDGRGAGLAAKVRATALEVSGVDTFESRVKIGVEPEGRTFHVIGSFLKERGFTKVRLLTNNPTKVEGLVSAGIDVEVMPLVAPEPNEHVRKLYETKIKRFGHHIE